MSKKQYTPRERFERYLKRFLRAQNLSRGSVESAKAFGAWLGQGQHTGGKPSVPKSSTEEGQHSKQQRTGWKLGWRERIRKYPELVKLADEAGVLDKPRPDALPGDFANPDPRVYSIVVPRPARPTEEPPRELSVAEAMRLWASKKNK